jgi:hypothetical protein
MKIILAFIRYLWSNAPDPENVHRTVTHLFYANSIRVQLAIISTCFLLGVTNSGLAASIGGSFIGRGADPADILAPTDSAGVIAQTNWNNIDSGGTFKGTSLAHIDSAGNFTSVKIIYDASDSWNSDGGTTTGNEKLMKGIIKANPDPDTARSTTASTCFITAGRGTTTLLYASEGGNFAQ